MNFERLKKIQNDKGYEILDVKPGQYLKIHEKMDSGRIFRFEGLVLKVQKPKMLDGTFTIRGKVAGVTIEKIYPLTFPRFEKVEIKEEYNVRKSKLYYMRDKIGKDARLKPKADSRKGETILG